jgi:hypothetical protein
MVYKRSDGRWCKNCPTCNVEQDYLRKSYAEASLRENKDCKSCSNKKTENCNRGYIGHIRVSWFKKTQLSAALRNIDFDLTIEQIDDMFIQQDFRCALTGFNIGFSEVGAIHTVSIDRIDSSAGYTIYNVQLLHKDVNMMKQTYSQERFIEICLAVADKLNEKKLNNNK